jgi:DNA-binding IscR family transcriptional regulator
MAVHALTVLAYKDGDRVTSALLAGSVNTNPVVIRRLLLTLQDAGLVETRKGAGFGSRLSRSPARINLAEIFRAVTEENPFTLPPNKPNDACPVGNCIESALNTVFANARRGLEHELEKITLGDILNAVRSCCVNGDMPVVGAYVAEPMNGTFAQAVLAARAAQRGTSRSARRARS